MSDAVNLASDSSAGTGPSKQTAQPICRMVYRVIVLPARHLHLMAASVGL